MGPKHTQQNNSRKKSKREDLCFAFFSCGASCVCVCAFLFHSLLCIIFYFLFFTWLFFKSIYRLLRRAALSFSRFLTLRLASSTSWLVVRVFFLCSLRLDCWRYSSKWSEPASVCLFCFFFLFRFIHSLSRCCFYIGYSACAHFDFVGFIETLWRRSSDTTVNRTTFHKRMSKNQIDCKAKQNESSEWTRKKHTRSNTEKKTENEKWIVVWGEIQFGWI